MKKRLNKKIKTGVMVGVIVTALVGCGSSSQGEQLAWIQNWNSMGNYQQKLAAINFCYKKVGITKSTKRISNQQNKMVNECELTYITKKAEEDGIVLDRKTLEANIFQF